MSSYSPSNKPTEEKKCLSGGVGRIQVLKDVSFLIPGNCEYVMVHGKGRVKAAGGIKVANQLTLRWGDYLDYPSGPSVITRSLQLEEGGLASPQHERP